jgi:hypothetical protein
MINQYAGKILNYIYLKKFEENKIPSVDDLLRISNWKSHQLEMALDYCIDHGYLDVTKAMGRDKNGIQSMFIMGITADGIDIISDKGRFKRSFGIEVNLGLVKFNWLIQQR